MSTVYYPPGSKYEMLCARLSSLALVRFVAACPARYQKESNAGGGVGYRDRSNGLAFSNIVSRLSQPLDQLVRLPGRSTGFAQLEFDSDAAARHNGFLRLPDNIPRHGMNVDYNAVLLRYNRYLPAQRVLLVPCMSAAPYIVHISACYV